MNSAACNIPDNIAASVAMLLQPYGVDFKGLLQSRSNSDNGIERKYITAAQASVYCGISQKTIRDKALAGVISSIRIGKSEKSRVLIEKVSLDSWLESFSRKNNHNTGE
ncbi:MAG: helix-turn-helix domain-containing protein [Lentisphaerota bacterium]